MTHNKPTRMYTNGYTEQVIEILEDHGYEISYDPQDDSYEIKGHQSEQ